MRDRVYVDVPEGVRDAINEACAGHGISVSDLMREAVASALGLYGVEVPPALQSLRPEPPAPPVEPPRHDRLLMALATAECRAAGAPADRVDLAAAMAADRMRLVEHQGQLIVQVVDKAGEPRIGNVAGDDLTLSAWVAELAKDRPLFFRANPEAEAASTGKPTSTPDTVPTSLSEAMRQKLEQVERDEREYAAQRLAWANPWVKGQENLTHQCILENREPARAAKFKAAAGVRG